MSAGLIVGLMLVGAVVAWVARPLWEARRQRQQVPVSSTTERLENLLFEREAALLAIRDVQLDYEMGKLSEADFQEFDSRYRTRAIAIMQDLDTLGVSAAAEPAADSLDSWIERAVAEARQGKASKPSATGQLQIEN